MGERKTVRELAQPGSSSDPIFERKYAQGARRIIFVSVRGGKEISAFWDEFYVDSEAPLDASIFSVTEKREYNPARRDYEENKVYNKTFLELPECVREIFLMKDNYKWMRFD